MTLREKVCASGKTTLRDFLCLPCEGGGEIIHTPISLITCDLLMTSLDGDLTKSVMNCDLEITQINATISTQILSADIINIVTGDLKWH
jgi:hypothetical protein